MSNVFRFSVKQNESQNDSAKLVDMNVVEEVVSLSKNAVEVSKRLEEELSMQNNDNSEQNSLKKFIREQIESSERDGKTRHVQVVDGDGLADLVIEKAVESVQVQCEYHQGQVDWKTCKDLAVIYLNSDQPNFEEIKAQALANGIKRIETTLSTSIQCEELAEMMDLEKKVTGNPAAIFFPHAYSKEQAIKLVEIHGIVSAKAWAKVGGAVAISKNFVDVITGDKTIGEATKAIATSTARDLILDYASSVVLSTAVRKPVIKAAVKLGGEVVAKKIGSNAIGTTALTGISTADAFVTKLASNAILSSAGVTAATITEIGGTFAAVASSAGFTGTAGAITAGTAGIASGIGAVAALATPLAPIAIGGAAIYGAKKLLSKLF